MKFKRICPKIAEECVGEDCAAFNTYIRETYFYDFEDEKIINYVGLNYEKKKTDCYYKIVERHYNLKKITKNFKCSEYPLLKKSDVTNEEIDLNEVFQGCSTRDRDRYVTSIRSKYDARGTYSPDYQLPYRSFTCKAEDGEFRSEVINEKS